MKRYFFTFLFAFAAVCAAAPAYAVPAAPGVTSPRGMTCRPNPREVERRAKAWRAAKESGVSFATIGVKPSTTTPRVLVIRVHFSDVNMSTPLASTRVFFNKVHDFFLENSYGVFNASFTVSSSIYRLSGTLATYGADCGGDVACNDTKMFNEATSSAAASGLSFAGYDHIMIYHAGNGQETSNVANDIWSVYLPDSITAGGRTFDGFTVVPEKEAGRYDPLGVICHEYGHQLGLPDLYDTSVPGGKSTVGVYDVMDYPYTGTSIADPDGSNPPHLGAWSKNFLGFITPQSQSGLVSFSPAETTSTAFLKIPVAGGGANEYFLIEYRLRTAAGYDRGLPMNGLAIWHIDDDVALNPTIVAQNIINAPSLNGRGYYGIDLVEADGTQVNPSSPVNDLGNGNLFVAGNKFASPQSDSFGGLQSGVAVSDISGVGTSAASARVAFIQAAASLDITKVVNYPNPGGDPSKYPVRTGAPAGTVTTLMLQLNKPVDTGRISLDIYSANGDRVRSVSGSDIVLRLGSGQPTTDNKWVYEYDWNGNNDSGTAAASGVYFYRFKANGSVETGRLVLVR